MKYKILSFVLCLTVLFGTYALIKYLPSDIFIPNGTSPDTKEEVASSESGELSRAYVIETAHDTEELLERLAYGENKNFESALSDLVTRLQNSSEYLKNELKDYYGASYFSTVSTAFDEVLKNPFSDSASFGTRVAKILTELENAYPSDAAAALDENHPQTPMYYPKFDTSANGVTSLAMLSIYREQYQKNNSCILLTFGGNLCMGDTLLSSEDENGFKTLSSKSKYPFPLYKLSSVLANDTASFANLETPLTNTIGGAETANLQKGLPEYAKLIKKGGIDVLSIANNAISSYGDGGKSDTVAALSGADIQITNEGSVAYYQTALGPVAYLTYNIIDEIAGSVNLTYADTPKADIAAAKENGAKFVVVHFNWVNTETNAWDPCISQVLTTRAAVENGADLVLGTHPNSIEAIEEYNGVSIIYSPGNLSNRNGEGFSSFLFQQAFSLDDSGKAVHGEIQVFPLSDASDGSALPSLILDTNGANKFASEITNASSTVRYGVGRRSSFLIEDLHLISIQK